MIFAKTKLRKMPKSCGGCTFARHVDFDVERTCVLAFKECPMEKSPNGNWRYGKPLWCPLRDAIDNERKRGQEIEEHTQRIAWVSCAERLPTDERSVLAYTGYENSQHGFISIMSYFAHDPTPHWQYSGLLRPNQAVLYWMPLPEPPTYRKKLTAGKTNGTTKDALKRPATIEDILGDTYDLDHLRELVEADKDGRCAALPCKIGG